jgi:hypothetical protein
MDGCAIQAVYLLVKTCSLLSRVTAALRAGSSLRFDLLLLTAQQLSASAHPVSFSTHRVLHCWVTRPYIHQS